MSLQNYTINPNKPAFSALDDDDDDITAFMNTSSAKYLAEDRLPAHSREVKISPEEEKRDNLLQRIQKVEQRTLESSKRSLGAIIESEKIGIETAQELSKQHEQLTNAENKLDDINYTLKDTQKNINGIKSVFSSLKQWWSTPKQKDAIDAVPSAASLTTQTKPQEPKLTRHLESAVEHSQNSIEFAQNASHPALRLRGYEDVDDTDDFKAHSKRVNEQLDGDLGMMSSGLSRLKVLAQGLGDEIVEQNELLDRIGNKAERADVTINSQNTQMNRIMGRTKKN